MKKYKGELGLLVTAMIWGGGFAASKAALETNLTPYQITGIRFFIGTLLLSAIYHKHFKKMNSRVLLSGLLLGFFLCGAFTLQTMGLQYTTASKNAFLTAINVVMVPFIGLAFFREKIDVYGIAGGFLAAAGAGVLMLNGAFTVNIGDVLTLFCALCFAFHIYCVGIFVQTCDAVLLTIIQFAFACVFSVPMMLLFPGGQSSIGVNGILSLLYLGVLSTGVAFLLQNVSQTLTTSTRAAIILSSESVFGSLASVLFLGEALTFRTVLGCLMIIAAVLIVETKLPFLNRIRRKVNVLGQNGGRE
ncbi:MAG: DMT family transporter [Clostridiales bacterium]|nr:DMT family transporter [Clostridiales bacterium]